MVLLLSQFLADACLPALCLIFVLIAGFFLLPFPVSACFLFF